MTEKGFPDIVSCNACGPEHDLSAFQAQYTASLVSVFGLPRDFSCIQPIEWTIFDG